DLPLFIRDGGFIAAGYNPELDELRTLRDESRRLIAGLQNKYSQETEVSSLKICHNNVLGYYVEVTAKHGQALLESEAKGKTTFIHRQTLANTARFTTVELSSLEEKIRGAAEKAVALELAMFEELVKEVMVRAEEISKAGRVFAVLDVEAALALLAQEKNYIRPVIDNSLAFVIKKGRHPVVEDALTEARETAFVANDCEMDEEKSRLWLITGPNMAGKSTFLRQNALIAIMAQMGSFVPAEFAKIGVVDKIFSRVGASDDLARGRSTFMVEMVETAAILNRSTERSFVILDEIGRGTATFDGLAIAWAVAESLHEKNKCRALFATHYHELTVLAERLSRLSLHTMKTKEWQDNVVFLHEVGDGCADRSYGIHVAKLAGLPAPVIKRAKKVLEELETKNNQAEKLAGDLPLFAAFEQEMKAEEEYVKEESSVQKAVREINPDALSPREALDIIYQLVQMVKDET
ncbi:MAG: DNA mismatch repair protein MutS, partial [Elusimicrobiaceae bacterium]|nr:DNA mismatch repair protein MutS [Elusimicrobiaceae bacterium]